MAIFKPIHKFLLFACSSIGMVIISGCMHQGGYQDINGRYYYAANNGVYYNSRPATTIETAQNTDNNSLANKVKERLQADEELKDVHIIVTGVKDQIELSGYVNNNSQRLKAIDIARHVPDVHLVADKLSVKLF